jgi:hypothetical protein
MTLIVLRIVRCIDYLAYGGIFTRAMFQPKIKGEFFFTKNPVDEPWEVMLGNLQCQYQEVLILALIVGINRFSAE